MQNKPLSVSAAWASHVTRTGAYEHVDASIGTAADGVHEREGMTRGQRVPRKPFNARTACVGWDARLRPDVKSGRVFISPASLRPVLGLERAENRCGEFEPDEEARAKAKVIMMVALDGHGKAA